MAGLGSFILIVLWICCGMGNSFSSSSKKNSSKESSKSNSSRNVEILW